MSGALTYREGQPDGSDPVELFFDTVGFLLGCMLDEVGLDIVIDYFFGWKQWPNNLNQVASEVLGHSLNGVPGA